MDINNKHKWIMTKHNVTVNNDAMRRFIGSKQETDVTCSCNSPKRHHVLWNADPHSNIRMTKLSGLI